MTKVILIQNKNPLSESERFQPERLTRMFEIGIKLLSGSGDLKDTLHSIFKHNEKIGIKINTIAGKRLSTRPEVSLSLSRLIAGHCTGEDNITIWDRSNRELKQAGYHLNLNRKGIKVFGTDTEGIGYGRDLLPHLNTGSLFSTIQERLIHSSISLAVLKDHGLAGVTAGMKNYFGAIHNPNKYHDHNCNPFIAEIFDHALIKKKHRLSVLDALTIQYHRGPAYHSEWAERSNTLIFGFDPVAVDAVGWNIIEVLRAQKGLPSIKEEKRVPLYLETANRMGLGQNDLDKIQIMEEKI